MVEGDSHWKSVEGFMGAVLELNLELSREPLLLFLASLYFMIRAGEEKRGFAIFPHNVSWKSPHNL